MSISLRDAPAEPYAALLGSVAARHFGAIVTERLSYEHDGTALEGFLARPDGDDATPYAVLVVHAWSGVGPNVEMRALMLAKLGYTSFAADIYGAGVRPSTFPAMKAEADTYYADLPLLRARVAVGFDVLRGRGFAAENIVVIGYCFGGTAALEFARTGQACAGFVSFHGNLIVHDPSDAAAIAAPLLLLTGAADEIVPDEAVKAFADELRTASDINWEIISYADAPHAFTVPGDRYRATPDRRSWSRLVDFLDEVFEEAGEEVADEVPAR